MSICSSTIVFSTELSLTVQLHKVALRGAFAFLSLQALNRMDKRGIPEESQESIEQVLGKKFRQL